MREEQITKLLDDIGRIAHANEELIRLATEERDTGESIFGPPFCPHCGTFNPSVSNEGGRGAMAEFTLIGRCGNCENTFYAFPQGWLCYATRDEAMQEMERRKQ